MSKAEVERFVKETNADKSIHEEVQSLLGDEKALVAWANERGYDFSLDDLTAFVEENKAQLKEEDLDQVAAGTGEPGVQQTMVVAPELGPVLQIQNLTVVVVSG